MTWLVSHESDFSEINRIFPGKALPIPDVFRQISCARRFCCIIWTRWRPFLFSLPVSHLLKTRESRRDICIIMSSWSRLNNNWQARVMVLASWPFINGCFRGTIFLQFICRSGGWSNVWSWSHIRKVIDRSIYRTLIARPGEKTRAWREDRWSWLEMLVWSRSRVIPETFAFESNSQKNWSNTGDSEYTILSSCPSCLFVFVASVWGVRRLDSFHSLMDTPCVCTGVAR